MYLLRLPNSVYYTRIATPLSLRESGYPKEFKFSLLTRERKTAYLRNIEQVQLLHGLFEKAIRLSLCFVDFKAELANATDALRLAYQNLPEAQTRAPQLSTTVRKREAKGGIDSVTLEQFVATKQLEGVTQLTLKQLSQRCGDFLAYMKAQGAIQPTNGIAMEYRNALLRRGLSHKTLKDYLAANKQFFNWCVAKEQIASNPFAVIKPPTKLNHHTHDERQRWNLTDLKRLLQSDVYQKQSQQFKWITLLMMYQGCRLSEACQLRVQDIQLDGLPCIQFTDTGNTQRLKNASSRRVIPIHPTLLELGFAAYVNRRKRTKKTQLFDLTPRGDDHDWSKDYRDTFGRVLDSVGFKAGERATAYSFRHTFIDELKRANVEEHIVSQLVGHKYQAMTYGRYGKPLEPGQLMDALGCFSLGDIEAMLAV
ncbi:tyrosine-type recombinase/integrase [Photobacterium damselae]|uniref:tyrosine-type recombinase/integrase n=1 Tax=Photobacterium damselae TaxID=38293 RepID=UPI002543B4D0